MDLIVWLKECISKLQGTDIERNVILARNVEKLVMSYISCMCISLQNVEEYNDGYKKIPHTGDKASLDRCE